MNTHNVIIAGSRKFSNFGIENYEDWFDQESKSKIYDILDLLIKSHPHPIGKVISGCCWGIDKLGEEWAEKNGIEVIKMPAEWKKLGKSAGPIRNSQMAEIADSLICLYDKKGSSGSEDMIRKMKNLKKIVTFKTI
jgi:hypothetical protein